jgi:hypothetical protein
MDANLITALAEYSAVTGASAAIAATWISQHSGELEVFKHFSDACRVELRNYAADWSKGRPRLAQGDSERVQFSRTFLIGVCG